MGNRLNNVLWQVNLQEILHASDLTGQVLEEADIFSALKSNFKF